jgi:hypothetical protein
MKSVPCVLVIKNFSEYNFVKSVRVTIIPYLKSCLPQLVTDLDEIRYSISLTNIAEFPENRCSGS